MKTMTLEVRGLFEELDHLAVERHLAVLHGVHRAEANPASPSVTVRYDETMMDEETLRRTIENCGFHCAGEQLPDHICKMDHKDLAGHKPHAAHGAGHDMAAMVKDMRNRFWVALLFTIPIFTYSPMGGMFTPPTPPFGLRLDLWLFFLGSAAIVWPSTSTSILWLPVALTTVPFLMSVVMTCLLSVSPVGPVAASHPVP